jgi:hypothetical protein
LERFEAVFEAVEGRGSASFKWLAIAGVTFAQG